MLSYATNFIYLQVTDDNNGSGRLTGFYGYLDRSRRKESWSLLHHLSHSSSLPWRIVGDFNDLLNVEDKLGLVEHPQWLFGGFRDAVRDCNLIDLHLDDYPYTW